MSFPTRERGLKYVCSGQNCNTAKVVPHEGTWIEIIRYSAWEGSRCEVVPHEGTWIEMLAVDDASCVEYRRSPRGNVD